MRRHIEGHFSLLDAGWRVLMRCEVARAAWQFEREAHCARGIALRLHDTLETTDYYPEAAASIRETRADMERQAMRADWYETMAADCRHWLAAK